MPNNRRGLGYIGAPGQVLTQRPNLDAEMDWETISANPSFAALLFASAYGVTGNGTNETAAWQSVIAAIPSGGAHIICPAGISQITPGTLKFPNSVNIDGGGVYTFQYASAGSLAVPLLGASAATPQAITFTGVVVDTAGFTGSIWRNTSTGVNPAARGITFLNCVFFSSAPTAARTNGFLLNADNNLFEGCLFANLTGCTISNSGTAGDVFTFNVAYSSGAVAMQFSVQWSSVGALITDNVINGVSAPILKCTGFGSAILDNTIINGAGTGSNSFVVNVANFGSIAGNVLYNNLWSLNTLGGINLGTRDCSATDNVIVSNTFGGGAACLLADGVQNATVSGNVIADNSVSSGALTGMNLITGGASVPVQPQSIAGNVVIGPGTAGTAHIGMLLATATQVTIDKYAINGNVVAAWNTGMSAVNGPVGPINISGNTFDSITGNGVVFNAGVDGIVVNDNLFNGCGGDAGAATIFLTSVNDYVISDNSFVGDKEVNGVINLVSCLRGQIGPNLIATVAGAPVNAITTDTNCHGHQVHHNLLSGTSTSISLAGVANTDYVKDNNFQYTGAAFVAL